MEGKNEPTTKIKIWQRYTNFCQKHSFNKHIIIVLVIALVLLIAVLGFLTSKSNNKISSRTVEFGLKSIGELATQAGYFTSVQTINGSRDVFGVTVPFTQSKYIYSYDGVVKAGINFNEVQVSLNDINNIMTVTIPAPYIIDVTVDEDSLVVYDESKNIFSPLKLNEVRESISIMKQEVTEKAISNGILINAKNNAELLITGFLQGSFPQETYTINFIWK